MDANNNDPQRSNAGDLEYANGRTVPTPGAYSSSHPFEERSPFIHVLPEEAIEVLDYRFRPIEKATGNSLSIGDFVRYLGRLYRVIKQRADYGAIGREVGYAPVSW